MRANTENKCNGSVRRITFKAFGHVGGERHPQLTACSVSCMRLTDPSTAATIRDRLAGGLGSNYFNYMCPGRSAHRPAGAWSTRRGQNTSAPGRAHGGRTARRPATGRRRGGGRAAQDSSRAASGRGRAAQGGPDMPARDILPPRRK